MMEVSENGQDSARQVPCSNWLLLSYSQRFGFSPRPQNLFFPPWILSKPITLSFLLAMSCFRSSCLQHLVNPQDWGNEDCIHLYTNSKLRQHAERIKLPKGTDGVSPIPGFCLFTAADGQESDMSPTSTQTAHKWWLTWSQEQRLRPKFPDPCFLNGKGHK